MFKSKTSFHYEEDVKGEIEDLLSKYSKTVFDKTRIKSMSESGLINKEFQVKQILPMIQVDGILYLTNKRIYFQAHHSIEVSPVSVYKIKEITELYKRRFKLQDLGIEIICTGKKDYKGHCEKQNLYMSFVNSLERDQVY